MLKKDVNYNAMDITGQLDSRSRISSENINDAILIRGVLFFNNLSLQMGNLRVEEINGRLPFTHILTKNKMDRNALASKNSEDDLKMLNYPISREYQKIPDNFMIKNITLNDITIDNIKFDMSYNNNFFSINKGYMEFMNGIISMDNSYFDLGNLSPDTFRYKFNMEASGIDIIRFKKIKVEKGEDTTIFANMRFSGKGFINTSAQGVDFSRHAGFIR